LLPRTRRYGARVEYNAGKADPLIREATTRRDIPALAAQSGGQLPSDELQPLAGMADPRTL
jgi:hypothetical protein